MNREVVYSGMCLHHIPPDVKHVTGKKKKKKPVCLSVFQISPTGNLFDLTASLMELHPHSSQRLPDSLSKLEKLVFIFFFYKIPIPNMFGYLMFKLINLIVFSVNIH